MAPNSCPLCEDDRGAVPRTGASWTTLAELQREHRTTLQEHEPNLLGIGCSPFLGVGQRALLVGTSEGNVLWDCIPLIDEEGIESVRSRGGIAAIAVSHPHFYGAMVDWSHAFGGIPIYVHAADQAWVTRSDPSIVFWQGEHQTLFGDITLVRCGGHFDGATLLHWPAGADGRGALLTADPMAVTADRHVSFMHSYPNNIPLSAGTVARVVKSVEPFAFDRIYGGWFWTEIEHDAKDVVTRSAERYLRALRD